MTPGDPSVGFSTNFTNNGQFSEALTKHEIGMSAKDKKKAKKASKAAGKEEEKLIEPPPVPEPAPVIEDSFGAGDSSFDIWGTGKKVYPNQNMSDLKFVELIRNRTRRRSNPRSTGALPPEMQLRNRCYLLPQPPTMPPPTISLAMAGVLLVKPKYVSYLPIQLFLRNTYKGR